MNHARNAAYLALGASFSCIIIAVLLGICAASGDWERGRVVSSTAALAVLAELTFWLGGGILGYQAVHERRESFGRMTERLLLWRRS